LTISNAGAPYPILVRDGVVQSIRIAGIPLGLYPDTEYEETTLELQPGDAILFASDGILEAENSDLEEFGVDRLSAVLASMTPMDSASDIADKIVTATDQHVGPGLHARDDRTLLVLRVTDHTSSDFSKLPIIY